MKEFRRRIYRNLPEIVTDLRNILAQRSHMKVLLRGTSISAAFRERLMLAVTGVNACRYCSYVHTQQALSEGLSPEEIADLQEGELAGSPPAEQAALLYAQHWAETRGQPAAEARQRVLAQYGAERGAAMELALRAIQMSNLLGNTFDYLLYRASFGRWGGAH
jgi:AhpD family alkylhydroperoxidase